MKNYFSCKETAILVRGELKKHFPGIKFSVRKDEYAGGATVTVHWTDGPSRPSVEHVVKRFEGASFDGSIDLKSYVTGEWNGEEAHFGADYVSCTRKKTRLFVETVTRCFCQRYGIPMLEIKGSVEEAWVDSYRLDYTYDHELQKILEETDFKDREHPYRAEDEQEAREHARWQKQRQHSSAKQSNAQQKKQQEQERARQEKEKAEAKRRAEQEKINEQRRSEQALRDETKAFQRDVLSSRQFALVYLDVSFLATDQQIKEAFRKKVKELSDGFGGYNGDMDFLVKVKELALRK